MKKILSILGTIALIGTRTTSLVACNTPQEYTEEQLKELKEENKIIINGNTLEWMAPQEKPFNKIDNKWYFVIWRGNKNHDWRISKFKYNEKLATFKWRVDSIDKYELRRTDFGNNDYFSLTVNEKGSPLFSDIARWHQDTFGSYFKSVYRWNGNGEPKTLIIDPKSGKVTDRKEDKEVEVKEDK